LGVGGNTSRVEARLADCPAVADPWVRCVCDVVVPGPTRGSERSSLAALSRPVRGCGAPAAW